MRGAGFDYLFNSSKYWDFRQRWLLDQYEHVQLDRAFDLVS